MRSLPQRPPITSTLQARLISLTQEIAQVPDGNQRKEFAKQKYEQARKRKWFAPIVHNLRSVCGDGELCMYCSSNEPSQIEHYHPVSTFPERALEYENYTWSCDICNRAKGDKFPPTTMPGEEILNPFQDDVWDHFFLDEHFGRLLKRAGTNGEPVPRAVSTCEVVRIDRENVQIKRQRRYSKIRAEVQRLLNEFNSNTITSEILKQQIADMRSEPFQADVADYFLRGPGRTHEPFHSLLVAAEC